jgi:glutathione synthase/RimK-type ligase-like ATP-grasp enzyme
MRFFALHEGFYESVRMRLDKLEQSCRRLGVEFIALNSLIVDYSKLPLLGKSDLLYNVSRGSETLETILLNKNVSTFYVDNPNYITANHDTVKYSIIHEKASINSPKTIYNISTDRDVLQNYIEYLGGFPVLLKASGSTRGIGTIKIESWQNLISTIDYLINNGDHFIMRQFIRNNGAARIVVLKNEVIATEFRDNLQDDFRVSGSKVKNYYQKDFDNESYDMAILATRLANLETAGVDIIYDCDSKPYLLEINCPYNFIPTADVCGVDIAYEMVKYLMDKSIRNQQ